MKKIFSYIIIFILLIGVGLVDVRALIIDCECSSIDSNMDFSFTFRVDSNDLINVPEFSAKVQGSRLETNSCHATQEHCTESAHYYKLQNFSNVYGDDNSYYYKNEFYSTKKCPSYVIYGRNGHVYAGEKTSHHFYAADEASKDAIMKSANEDNDYGMWPDKEKDGTSYLGTCKTIIIEEDPVVSNSNEPSNEPVDPNSNIPEFNSQQTLRNNDVVYSCGNNTMKNIPSDIPRITRFLYIFLQILVPIGLVLVSSIDLFKAIAAQKEDDIKKGQQTLIKRIITAVIVFFVFAIVKLVISVISDNSEGIIDCVSCFLENSDEYCKTM